MNASKANIEFSYLYRDAGNYKQYHTEVFTNKTGISLEVIRAHIRSYLIDSEWFYVDKWQLRDLHFDTWDNELDHTWHEFDDARETNNIPTKDDISEFLTFIASAKTQYKC